MKEGNKNIPPVRGIFILMSQTTTSKTVRLAGVLYGYGRFNS